MPAKRLPWFKLWIGCTAHGKVRQLDDGTFRTWVELLDAASQQPTRGRFASEGEAAAITRRPIKHIRTLVQAGLIDAGEDGLWLHDWSEWQDVYPSDVSRERSANTPPNTPPNAPRTPGEGSAQRSPKKREEEGRVKTTPNGVVAHTTRQAIPKPKPKHPPVDDAYIEELVTEFGEWARRSIDRCLNHKAHQSAINKQKHLRGWLEDDVERRKVTPLMALRPTGTEGAGGLSYAERLRRGITHV